MLINAPAPVFIEIGGDVFYVGDGEVLGGVAGGEVVVAVEGGGGFAGVAFGGFAGVRVGLATYCWQDDMIILFQTHRADRPIQNASPVIIPAEGKQDQISRSDSQISQGDAHLKLHVANLADLVNIPGPPPFEIQVRLRPQKLQHRKSNKRDR